MTSTLTIEPTAAPGAFSVVVLDGQNPIGKADFGILDPTAGPIPSGLTPQVDASFVVVGQKICEDTFGKRVAHSLYCVAVRIGNNSGYPLQIAGIGFLGRLQSLPDEPHVTFGNNTYASTRSVLLRESVLSRRNMLYNSVQATGLLMAAFTPYFDNPRPKSHFATAASIVSGALLQAFNIVAPDRVVGQLNNLDDQSFRDNQIIPNNSQMVTMVFIEKSAVTEALRDIGIQLISETSKMRLTFTGDAQNEYDNAIAALKETTSRTIRNSERPSWEKGTFSPLLVKLALGNLVIVGDQIQYLQRVQVQSNAPTLPSSVRVVISPTAVPVMVGESRQFTATVEGTTSTGVTWSVNGDSTVGTISSTGLYAAPAAIPIPNPITVRATSTADSRQFASATVTITASPVTVTIDPDMATVAIAMRVRVTPTVRGSGNTSVTWTVNGVPNGDTSVGTIESEGSEFFYRAPATIPSQNPVRIVVSSVAAPMQSAEAMVTVTAN
jgi:hypothetical protein